jgi:hypothetical protein
MTAGAHRIGATGVISRDLRRAAYTGGVTREAVGVIRDAVRNRLLRGGHRGGSRERKQQEEHCECGEDQSGASKEWQVVPMHSFPPILAWRGRSKRESQRYLKGSAPATGK